MHLVLLLLAGTLAGGGPDFGRIIARRSHTQRCGLLPHRLQTAPAQVVDLNADGRLDRVLELPGSCVVSACTWRAYVGCAEGGHRLLLERIALSVEPVVADESPWMSLRVAVPAPATEPQAWIYQYDGDVYSPTEPL